MVEIKDEGESSDEAQPSSRVRGNLPVVDPLVEDAQPVTTASSANHDSGAFVRVPFAQRFFRHDLLGARKVQDLAPHL